MTDKSKADETQPEKPLKPVLNHTQNKKLDKKAHHQLCLTYLKESTFTSVSVAAIAFGLGAFAAIIARDFAETVDFVSRAKRKEQNKSTDLLLVIHDIPDITGQELTYSRQKYLFYCIVWSIVNSSTCGISVMFTVIAAWGWTQPVKWYTTRVFLILFFLIGAGDILYYYSLHYGGEKNSQQYHSMIKWSRYGVGMFFAASYAYVPYKMKEPEWYKLWAYGLLPLVLLFMMQIIAASYWKTETAIGQMLLRCLLLTSMRHASSAFTLTFWKPVHANSKGWFLMTTLPSIMVIVLGRLLQAVNASILECILMELVMVASEFIEAVELIQYRTAFDSWKGRVDWIRGVFGCSSKLGLDEFRSSESYIFFS